MISRFIEAEYKHESSKEYLAFVSESHVLELHPIVDRQTVESKQYIKLLMDSKKDRNKPD